LGITAYDRKAYIIDKFLDSIRSLTYKNIEILFVDNSKTEEYADYIRNEGFEVIRSGWFETTHERLTDAYNTLRVKFLEGDYSHLMVIEQDIIAPNDTIERLLQHDKDVCSGLYYLADTPCVMVGGLRDVPPGKEREFRFEKKVYFYDFIDEKILKTKKLVQVFCCGLGCVLIKREVLEKVEFRIKKNPGGEWKGHNDMFFYFDLRARNIKVFLDPTIKCEHYNDTY